MRLSCLLLNLLDNAMKHRGSSLSLYRRCTGIRCQVIRQMVLLTGQEGTRSLEAGRCSALPRDGAYQAHLCYQPKPQGLVDIGHQGAADRDGCIHLTRSCGRDAKGIYRCAELHEQLWLPSSRRADPLVAIVARLSIVSGHWEDVRLQSRAGEEDGQANPNPRRPRCDWIISSCEQQATQAHREEAHPRHPAYIVNKAHIPPLRSLLNPPMNERGPAPREFFKKEKSKKALFCK